MPAGLHCLLEQYVMGNPHCSGRGAMPACAYAVVLRFLRSSKSLLSTCKTTLAQLRAAAAPALTCSMACHDTSAALTAERTRTFCQRIRSRT